MSNKTLAFIGIGLYVLQVLSSASDVNGNPQAPAFLILLAGTGTLVFMVIVSKRLWTSAKYITLVFLISGILSAFAPFLLTAEPSGTNVLVNAVKVVSFLVYFYVVFLLFAMSKKSDVDSNQT